MPKHPCFESGSMIFLKFWNNICNGVVNCHAPHLMDSWICESKSKILMLMMTFDKLANADISSMTDSLWDLSIKRAYLSYDFLIFYHSEQERFWNQNFLHKMHCQTLWSKTHFTSTNFQKSLYHRWVLLKFINIILPLAPVTQSPYFKNFLIFSNIHDHKIKHLY